MVSSRGSVFTVRDLSFAYEGQPSLFDGLSLEIPEGVVTTIIGANGCGKSTLLTLLTRNLVPMSGQVFLRQANIADLRLLDLAKLVAVVHQSNTAPYDMTVEKLVALGRFPYHHAPRATRPSRQEDEQAVGAALSATGLTGLEHRTLASLSGGQRQRAWIATALAQGTRVLLLDEPTTFLDIRYQLEILRLVRSLNQQFGMTIVMVLHDVNQAFAYSNEVIALAEGRVLAQGAPANIVSRQLLSQVYGVDLDIVGVNGAPFVLTV